MFYLVIAVILGLSIYYYSNEKTVITRNTLRHSAMSKTEEIKDGDVVKVVGKVVYSGATLKAPISGRTCAYYFVEILQSKYSVGDAAFEIISDTRFFNNNGYWHCILKKESASKLLLKNDNNYILIETKNINSSVVIDHHQTENPYSIWRALPGKENPVRMQEFLEKNGFKNIDLQSLGYLEGVFEEGETISAIGKARWKDVKDTKLNIPASKILIIGANGAEPVLVSDHLDTTRF